MSGVSPHRVGGFPRPQLTLLAALAGCLLWAYWPLFAALEERWRRDPQTSHGFVVPALAAIVLWARRPLFPAGPWRLHGRGLAWLAAAAALRLGGAYVLIDWFDGVSFLAALTGVCVLAGGRPLLRWAWPGLVMLLFLLPLPYQFDIALAAPLQRLATLASTYALQTLGWPAAAEGNVILIEDQRIGVLEACNGLGMLSAFFALSTAVAFVIRRPPHEKIIVFLSAIPIGVLVNLTRVTASGVAYATLSRRTADALFHDFAGWFMMPLPALLLLGLELLFLKWLVVVKPKAGPAPLVLTRTAVTPAANGAGSRNGSPASPVPVADGGRPRGAC